jgi:acyl-CoA synthetase (AMP-forming)/AMP-acid ligase II
VIGSTLGQAFSKSAALWPEKVAVVDPRISLTYAALEAQSNALANSLSARGIGAGDRVAMWMNNRAEYVVTEIALFKIGAVRVPMNQLVSDEEAARRIALSGAKAAICGPEFLHRVLEVRGTLGSPLALVGIDQAAAGTELWGDLVVQGAPEAPTVIVDADQPAAIMFTGGTTGLSKGIVHTHNTILATTVSCILEWSLAPEHVMLHVTPLPHGAGFMLFAGLVRGCRNLLIEKFTAENFLQAVEREKVNWTFLVPTMLYMILDSGLVSKHETGSLSTILYGAAPMAPARVQEALKAFGPVLVQAYAQMEAINSGTLLSKADHVEALTGKPQRLASCGRSGVIPTVRIVNAEDVEVGVGEVGEIVIKSPHVMKGYWQNPEATAQALRGGWLHTGDMARRDAEGYLYIVDRAKDVIITGGMNVYSSVVEAALFAHPAVASAAVFAVPDEKWGEAVRAHVILRDGCRLVSQELHAFCRAQLARYEVPKQIAFVERLPMTPYGKIDKKALRQPYWEGTDRNVG